MISSKPMTTIPKRTRLSLRSRLTMTSVFDLCLKNMCLTLGLCSWSIKSVLPGKFPKEESYLPFLTTSKPKRISAYDQKASTIDHLDHGTPNGCTLRETCDKINFSSREREEDSPNNPEMPSTLAVGRNQYYDGLR